MPETPIGTCPPGILLPWPLIQNAHVTGQCPLQPAPASGSLPQGHSLVEFTENGFGGTAGCGIYCPSHLLIPTPTDSKSHRSPSFASSFEEGSVKRPLVAHLRGKTGPEPLGPLQASLTWQSLNFLWDLFSSFIEFFFLD